MRSLRFGLALATYFATSQAFAQSMPCASRATVLKALADNWGEVPVNRGLITNGQIVEIVASPNGGWTMIFTRPDGISCLVLSGWAWQAVEPALPAPKEAR